MNPYEYQTIIEKTAVYPKEIGILYCCLGLAGETGEICEKIKKIYRDKPEIIKGLTTGIWTPTVKYGAQLNGVTDNIEAGEIFVTNLTKELGDVLWYITALASELNIDLATIMETNYNKLIKRRETDTLHGDGDDREES